MMPVCRSFPITLPEFLFVEHDRNQAPVRAQISESEDARCGMKIMSVLVDKIHRFNGEERRTATFRAIGSSAIKRVRDLNLSWMRGRTRKIRRILRARFVSVSWIASGKVG